MVMKFADYKQYLSPVLVKNTDLVIEKAHGLYMTDVNGDEYLDIVQGIAVNVFGHTPEKVVKAIQDQAAAIIHGSFNLANYPSTLTLAKRLAEKAPGEGDKKLTSIFFTNGGAEANDSAIKMARCATGRPLIIAMTGSFHGRTIGTTTVTGSNSHYREAYEPLMGGVYFTPYPQRILCPKEIAADDLEARADYCLWMLENTLKFLAPAKEVAAIIMEPVQGEGGYVVPHKKFVQGVRKICDDNGILLIFDEIQSGYGRTGKMWASEHFDVVPDVMTLGKAIGGGLPMSAVLSTPTLMNKWNIGTHGTTFGGNPVCAAAGNAVLDLMEETNVVENAAKMGEYLQEKLRELQKKYPVMADVRGVGLMTAVEFCKPGTFEPDAEALHAVQQYLLKEEKVLTTGCGVNHNGFRFITPLSVTEEELDLILGKFEKAVAAYKA
jgi:4-aminobutyrate aminotransferase